MRDYRSFRGARSAVFLGLVLASMSWGQSLIAELNAEHDPGKRSEKALDFADEAFNLAKDSYAKGDVHKGDGELDNMTLALKECAGSLDTMHKAKYYKKAEMKVAYLQRRMQGLLDNLGLQERGWAEYTDRKLEEIHERFLDGVMRK